MKSSNWLYSLFFITTLTSCSSNPAEYIAGVLVPDQKVVNDPKLPDEPEISERPKEDSFFDKIIFWESSSTKSKISNLSIDNIWSTDIGDDRDASSAVLQPSFDGQNMIYTIDTSGNEVNGTSLYIGRDWSTSDYFFDGEIDEVKVYRKALSSYEVLNQYNDQ